MIASVVISASYFWATAGGVNVYTIPVDIWGGERGHGHFRAGVQVRHFADGDFPASVGFIVDHHGYAPACWLVGLTPLIAWWLLRFLRD